MENSPSFVSNEIAHEARRFLTVDGDILISMTGTKYKRDYGFACPVDAGVLVNQRVGKIRAKKSKIHEKYLLICLRSSVFREQFFKGETGQVSQGNVGSEHIKKCMIPVPEIEEQIEIVRRVEQLFTFAERLDFRVQNTKSRIDTLYQSILAKAFRGELVSQNPNDEHACLLLERIQTQRALNRGKLGIKR
ncbi:Type-1 restriction enzyme EcoKI specificity protein [compost metagenome]